MHFKTVFLSVSIASALLLSALFLNAQRPARTVGQPGPEFVRAEGKCASCHRNTTPAVIHQFETSAHAAQGVTCIDCHRPAEGQEGVEHRGFTISTKLTSGNCATCHEQEYQQFLRSRHAAPSWAAVRGREAFTPEQLAFGERFHPGWVDRPANALALLEGESAIAKGCAACHEIGKPNLDGTIGSCTACHSRHSTSVALAREPETCGQCHMGPDHSQLEIYSESKHGVLFAHQRGQMNLAAKPKELTTKDMSVPTCATCHMSGLEGQKVTHDTTERLSSYLFDEVSAKRPNAARGQTEMQETCLKCHTRAPIERFYAEAEQVVVDTNAKVKAARDLVAALRAEKLLTPAPFDEPIEFLYFDLWHYYGRTAKHGAFMGGADFVQWHGNYELLRHMNELEHQAAELRARSKGE